MRKLTIILIGVFTCTLMTGQTYSSVVSDKEIYDFLNWLTVNTKKYSQESKLKQKRICHKILGWDKEAFVIDTILINERKQIIYLDETETLRDSVQIYKRQYVYDREYLYQKGYGADTIFNQHDRDFIFQQFTAIKDSIWHTSFSNSKLQTEQKQLNRHYYSIPLFSLNKNYVIINRYYSCGNECAYGGYYVYERINKKRWKFVTVINTWMS